MVNTAVLPILYKVRRCPNRIACGNGAGAVHCFVEHRAPALLSVTGKEVYTGVLHVVTNLFRRHCTKKFYICVQKSGFLRLPTELLFHFSGADKFQAEGISRFFEQTGDFYCIVRVLPINEPPAPQNFCFVFLSNQRIHAFIVPALREVAPLVRAVPE